VALHLPVILAFCRSIAVMPLAYSSRISGMPPLLQFVMEFSGRGFRRAGQEMNGAHGLPPGFDFREERLRDSPLASASRENKAPQVDEARARRPACAVTTSPAPPASSILDPSALEMAPSLGAAAERRASRKSVARS
jgi:hypothetical protein